MKALFFFSFFFFKLSKAIIKTKSNFTFKCNKGPKKLNESIKKLKIQMPCKCFELKLKIYKSKTKQNSKTQQNERIQPGQIYPFNQS